MSKRDRDALSDAIGHVIDIHKRAISIAPDRIASAAMQRIGFDYATHNAGWYGCYQHMLDLARDRLRGQFDPAARAQEFVAGQTALFDDALQDRYPRKPRRNADGTWCEPEYMLRLDLPEEDCWFNIDRLENVSAALLRHQKAFRAETINRYGPRKDAA